MKRLATAPMLTPTVTVVLLVALTALTLSPQASKPTPKPALDLTGTWTCDDEGTYWLRQVENTVWWMGKSKEEGQWCNLFKGTLTDKGGGTWELKGEWADLPTGEARNNGMMTLTITADEMKATEKTGGFGGSNWNRKKD